MSKAISSYKVYLCDVNITNGKYVFTKLIDIKDFPDMGGSPEMLDCTTTSDPIQTFIPGIQMLDNTGLEFTTNYTKANYEKVKNRGDKEQTYGVVYGGAVGDNDVVTNNGEGAFVFDGRLVAYPKGGSVNAVVDLGVSIAPTSKITYVADEKQTSDSSGGSSSTPTKFAIRRAYKRVEKQGSENVRKAMITATGNKSGLWKVISKAGDKRTTLKTFDAGDGEQSVVFDMPSDLTNVFVVCVDGTESGSIRLSTDVTAPTATVKYGRDKTTIDVSDTSSGIRKIGSQEYPNYPDKVVDYEIPSGTTTIDVEDALGNARTITIQEQ